jgi:pimeloyl-ACP methyl ester carboxylesterase
MRIDVNGTGIEVHTEGEGRPVLLVHGWPDTHTLWRHQIPALAGAGFRVIAPDLRGFGGSDKPDGVDAYAIPFLVGDVLGVLDHFGVERAHVVGHDWGAAISWAIASLAPDRVDHLVAISVGHPTSFAGPGIEQTAKAWHMLLFQFAGVAEEWLRADGWANFRAWSHHAGAHHVIAEIERDGSLTPGLNYYRANRPPESYLAPRLALPPIPAPTMGIWSSADMALLESQMTGSAEFVAGPWRYERLDGVGHWIPVEAPDALTALLLDFLPS